MSVGIAKEIRVQLGAAIVATLAAVAYALSGLGPILTLVIVATVVAAWPRGGRGSSREYRVESRERAEEAGPTSGSGSGSLNSLLSTLDARSKGRR